MTHFESGATTPRIVGRQRNVWQLAVGAFGFGIVAGVIVCVTLGTPVSTTFGAGDGSPLTNPSGTQRDFAESPLSTLVAIEATRLATEQAPTPTATATSTPVPTATPQPTMPTLAERYGICDHDTPAGSLCYQIATRIETPIPHKDCELGADWAGLCVATGDEAANAEVETR